jgi:hypothetical protein
MEVYPLAIYPFTVRPRGWRVKDTLSDIWASVPLIAMGMIGVGIGILVIWVTLFGLYMAFTGQSIRY